MTKQRPVELGWNFYREGSLIVAYDMYRMADSVNGIPRGGFAIQGTRYCSVSEAISLGYDSSDAHEPQFVSRGIAE